MRDSINWEAAVIASEWLDREVPEPYRTEQPLAQDWARVAKVCEEAGEAIDALIGVTGQNPRKGIINGYDKVYEEICDVALTAIYCLLHFMPAGEARNKLIARQRHHNERVGLAWPEEFPNE